MQPKQPNTGKFAMITDRTRMKVKNSTPPKVQTFEQAIAAWPIFGGTVVTDTGAGTPAATPPATPEGQAAQQSAASGGDQGEQKTDEDPVAKLQSDPNAIGQLLKQLEKVQGDLTKVAGERDQYVQKQQEQERAQQTKEQQLQTDLDNANAIIEKMDRVIRQTALTNAFLAQSDYQWNSIKQAMAEIGDDEIEISVDLDGGKAEIAGMENVVKRIAQQSPWLLKSGGVNNPPKGGGAGRGPQRGSGTPPPPPAGDAQKQSKRADLMKKFPVIAQGRRV